VPEGLYVGTCFRHRPAKKPCHRGCPLETQFTLDFSLQDPGGRDDGYIAKVQLCTKCTIGTHTAREFLPHWLGDIVYDYRDDDGNLDLDRLLFKKADVRIVHHHGAGHKHPFSKIEEALPVGTLIE
jgi:hypothetical protein